MWWKNLQWSFLGWLSFENKRESSNPSNFVLLVVLVLESKGLYWVNAWAHRLGLRFVFPVQAFSPTQFCCRFVLAALLPFWQRFFQHLRSRFHCILVCRVPSTCTLAFSISCISGERYFGSTKKKYGLKIELKLTANSSRGWLPSPNNSQ